MNRVLLVLCIVVLATLSACASPPAPTAPPAATQPPQIIKETVVVQVQSTPQVIEKVITATPPPPTTVPPTKAPQALPYRIGIFSDLKTTNYWSYQGPNNSVWQKYVMAPQRLALYNTDDKRFDLIPWVAADLNAPRVKEGDKWTTTVKMKKGVKWSDGTDITAKDVAFTANTAIELQLTGPMATTYDREYLERVEAVDDVTVKFIWKKAPGLAKWEWGAAQGHILSAAYWTPVVAEAKKALAGVDQANKDAYAKALNDARQVLLNHTPQNEPLAGSFTFAKWEKGAFAENKTNPTNFFKGVLTTVYKNGAYTEAKGSYTYKQGEPTGDKLVEYVNGPSVTGSIFTLYGTQDAAVLALKKGEIDFMLNSLGLQRGLMDQVQGQKGIQVITNPTNGFRYMAFNVRKPPMSDIAFRQALAYMIDKEFISKTILQNVAFPVYTEVAEANAFWYNPDVPKLGKGLTTEQRLAKAVELLEKAGYKWEGGKKPVWDKDGVRVTPGGRLIMPDGKPVPNLTLIAPSAGYDPLRSTFGIWIERYANELGVPLKAELIGFNDIITRVYSDPDYATKLDMYILGLSLSIFPSSLNSFHHSRFMGPGDNNAGGYNNPEYDKLADSLFDCQEANECRKIAFKLQEILATELPYITLFDTGIIETYRTVLQYPYVETLSGLQFVSGLPNAVAVNQ